MAAAIPLNRGDGKGLEDGVAGEAAVDESADPAVGADPQRAAAVEPQRAHLAGRKSVCSGECRRTGGRQVHEPRRRADPQSVLRVVAHRVDRIGDADVRPTFVLAGHEPAVAHEVEAAERADPEPPFRIGGERRDHVIREALLDAVRLERAIPVTDQPAARADPQRAGAVFGERGHRVLPERGRVAAAEHGEGDAVEAGEPFLGADPEVAVPRLADRGDDLLRQPLVQLPAIVDELRDGERRRGGFVRGAGPRRGGADRVKKEKGHPPQHGLGTHTAMRHADRRRGARRLSTKRARLKSG